MFNKHNAFWLALAIIMLLIFGCTAFDVRIVKQKQMNKQMISMSPVVSNVSALPTSPPFPRTNPIPPSPFISANYQIDIDPTWPTKLYLQTSSNMKQWNNIADTGTNQYFGKWIVSITNTGGDRFYRVRAQNYSSI